MNLNPILKVLSTTQRHHVQALLMGGQACVFYGAAEFSRDTDLAILASRDNLQSLELALNELRAVVVAVPPFESKYLERGHAIHFRCHHPDAAGMRVDIMSKMRGVDDFPELWKRRTTITAPDGNAYELLSLPDLVRAKKTQRDKDWPMIRRLLEASYFADQENPNPEQVSFFLLELRTPELLVETAQNHSVEAARLTVKRPLLKHALEQNPALLLDMLEDEERQERKADRLYWEPLKKELELLRHHRLQ